MIQATHCISWLVVVKFSKEGRKKTKHKFPSVIRRMVGCEISWETSGEDFILSRKDSLFLWPLDM